MTRFFVVALLFLLPACSRQRSDLLTITCIDVGQGDSILVSFPNGQHWLVDAGGTPAGDTESGIDPGHRNVLPVLRSKAIQTLDVVVMTHPDEDHVQGMLAVARHIPVKQLYWNGFEGSKTEKRVREVFQQQGTSIQTVVAGDQTIVAGVDVMVLGPPQRPILSTRSPENENSIILRINYRGKTALLTGDVEAIGEEELLRHSRDKIKDLSLLKVAHHGSDSSTIEAFVKQTRPETAFISCGKRNRYGHPSSEVINRLEHAGTRVHRTDECGMLEWTSDGFNAHVSSMLPCQ